MKNVTAAIAVLWLSISSAAAQRSANWGMYGGLQIAQTNLTGFKGSLDVHWNQKQSIGVSLAWVSRKSGHVPADYNQYRPVSWFGNNDPLPDFFYIWTLSYGRYFRLTHDGKLRVHARAGISAGEYEAAENYRLVYHSGGGWFGSSYTSYAHDDISRNFYGVTLNPALEYSPGRGFGFTAGAMACINNQRFCMAGEAGIIFGIIRNKAKVAKTGRQP
jgi:hypothetical protein